MSAISNFLSFLRSAIYAIDVRDGIADAIEQCYNDVNNPTLKTEALEAALQTKIDEGEMAALTIGDHTITAAKLAQGVIDNTLTTPGAAADAKKTGDEISAIKADLDNLEPGLSDAARAALLACFRNVAWTTADGQDHYVALENALCVTNRSISNGLIKITSDGLSGWGCSDGHGNKNTGQPFAGLASPSYPRNRLYADKGKTLAWADEYWAENELHAEGTYLIPVPSNTHTVTITCNPSENVYYALSSYGYNDETEQYGNRIEDSGWILSGNSFTLNSGAKYIAPLVKYTSGGREQLPNFTDVTIVFS